MDDLLLRHIFQSCSGLCCAAGRESRQLGSAGCRSGAWPGQQHGL